MVFVKFTFRERSDMVRIYLANNQSITAARREYIRRFPGRRAPSKLTFKRLATKLSNTGGVVDLENVRNHLSVLTEEIQIIVLGYFEAYPENSITNAACDLGLSRSSIHRVLKKYKFKAFKFTNVQKLSDTNSRRRLQFCEEFLQLYNEDNDILKKILWTDESSFSTRRGSNRQNRRFWSVNNPHKICEVKHQGYQSVSVWCGIVDTHILGPIFIDGRLTGNKYFEMLQSSIEEAIEELPLNVVVNLIWQQDGAPPHNILPVQYYLNSTYRNGWIGNNGTIRWPPNSPDLTIMDFFFWGHIKNMVYHTPCYTEQELRDKISSAVHHLRQTPEALINATNHTLKVYNKCIQQNGKHVEQFL